MVPKHITSILLLIAGSTSSIHAQSHAWSFSHGNSANDFESYIAIDEHSNMYTTGSFSGTIDFDPGPGNTSLTSGGPGFLVNTFITKFDSTGKFLWVKQLTGDIYQYARDIVYDSTGFIYVYGYYDGTCDFDPGPNQHNLSTSSNSDDSYVLKLDLNGNFIWAVSVGGNGQEYAQRMSLDANGNIIAGGVFSGTSDFDPGPNQSIFSTLGLADMFMVKYSSDGDFIWARHTTGTFNGSISGIVTDKDKNIYIGGAFDDRRDFNPQGDSMILQATGFWDIYVMKMDPAGNILWVRHMGNDNDNYPWDLAIDHKGYLFMTGHFSGDLDFDPGDSVEIHSAILRDIFVLKMDPEGQFVWAVPLGGISYEQGNGIVLDRNGGIYITGFYAETIDFDPGPGTYYLTSTGVNDEDDAFVVKLHPDGSFGWAHTLGGLDADVGYGIEIGAVDEIFMTGTFNKTAGFNPGNSPTDSLVSRGLLDVYYSRWRQCLESYGEFTLFSCGPYFSPSGNHVLNESGTYQDTIENKAGCDSIITIHLTISDLGLVVTQQGNTLIGSGGAGNFYWLDCDHDFSIVGQGNEFTPVANGNYALTGSGIICSDTSACFAFVMTAIKEMDTLLTVSVYPNPAENSFYIDLHQSYRDIDITLVDHLGIKIYSNHFTNEDLIQIGVDLPAGVYFITVSSDDKTFLKKLIVP
ncbi:MAG TPA: T9SS type A sorting domain-containing protein [Saprospiraceae bacterium]|nr:T9SS type A sorting domain-containing protein [Saprospiraceae bacterium]